MTFDDASANVGAHRWPMAMQSLTTLALELPDDRWRSSASATLMINGSSSMTHTSLTIRRCRRNDWLLIIDDLRKFIAGVSSMRLPSFGFVIVRRGSLMNGITDKVHWMFMNPHWRLNSDRSVATALYLKGIHDFWRMPESYRLKIVEGLPISPKPL